MRSNKNLSVNLLAWVIIVLLPFFITLYSLYIFMTPQFIQFEYSLPDFPPSERFTPQARYYNATQTVRYVWGEISLTDLENLGVYDAREIKHLVDVQNVARGALIFHTLSGILIALALIVLVRSPQTRVQAARALVTGATVTVAAIAAIGIFSLVAFNQFFVLFHRIFFEGETWLFRYSDSLIQFYPVQFWMAAAYGIALFVFVTALVIGASGWWWQRRKTSPTQERR